MYAPMSPARYRTDPYLRGNRDATASRNTGRSPKNAVGEKEFSECS